MNKEYITVNIPILDDVEEMKIVETFNQEQLWYVCAIAKAFEKAEQENKRLNNIINELEKWLEDYINLFDKPDVYEEQTLEDLKEVLDKLKELKEGKE